LTLDSSSGRRRQTRYINGKFACQHTTGVQRTAQGLLRALDRVIAQTPDMQRDRWIIVCPPGAKLPELQHIEVRYVGRYRAPLSLWEQFQLPWTARHGRLLNLAGSAPALARHQICMIHDAAVFDRPLAYTRTFRLWYRLLFKWLSLTAAGLLTVSEFSKTQLERHLRLPDGRLQVVHNGGDHLLDVEADPDALARFGVNQAAYVLAVGSDNPNKNLALLEDVVVRMFGRVGIRLVLVGGLNHRVFAADPHGEDAVDNNIVRRLGPISDNELKALYQGALGLVFPSLYEGFGLPPLEAMSCGCPVIASSAAAIPEVCGPAAAYFAPQSAEQLEALLLRLVEDAPWRAALRSAGTIQFMKFNWSQSVHQMLDHLAEAPVDAVKSVPHRSGTA
jgi:glycosyltransferase involved in cell wall biosynthesis